MFHTVICDLLGIKYPILQGAMQGGGGVELVAAVSEAGGLGVLPTFGGTDQKLRADIVGVRARTQRPFGVNIMPMGRGITERCAATCIELGIPIVTTGRADPGEAVVRRLKDAGIKVVSVIPTVEHARRMEAEGVDAVVASGAEAGGHVGTVSTLPLVPQVVDAVKVPVIAAGGIMDGRGIAAAFALGAAGVQLGTAYLRCPESKVIAPARVALAQATDESTVITNVMTGRPARGVANRTMREVGPISPDAPAFPHAATALGPLKAAAEKLGKVDFTNLWAGQAVRMGREMPAAELTRALAGAALARMGQMAG